MRKITILVLLMAMLTSVVFGLSTMASAEAEPIKVKVTAYNMKNSASFPWQANAEDEYCVFTGATDLNTGETNDVIVEFTAPAAGTINIANNWTFCANTSGAGDGARVRLIHNDVQLYPTDARWAEIPADKSNVFINVGEVAVEQGDKIYMVFNNGGNFSNASDSIFYCLGFTFNGNWFGSNDYWYATAEEGAATVTFAGVTCPKAELIQYKYGFVSDNAQGNVMAEGEFADANLGTLVGTTHDGVDRFKGNENSFCQFEAIGMNVVAGTPNLIEMKMTADGVFNFQNSYFKTFNNPATVEVIKNDKVIATHTVGGALSTLDAMQAVAVKANDVIYVRVTAESGAYLRYVVNGVLATANGVVSYSTRDTVLNAGGACGFYTTKERVIESLGDVTTAELKTVNGLYTENMAYSSIAGQWTGREQYSLIWKDSTLGVLIHTGATYSPAISYVFGGAGKAMIANLTVTVGSENSDGVRYRVVKRTADGASQQVYPLNAEWITTGFGDESPAVNTEIVSVAAGDELIFILNLNNTNSLDQSAVNFDVKYQAEGEEVEVHNVNGEYATANDTAWRYMDATVAVDYSSTVVGEVEDVEYTSLDESKIVLEEMTYFSTLNRWGIAGRAFLQIESGSLHPSAIYSAAIGIKMPADGRVDMSETVFKYDAHTTPDADGNVSDGVRVRVLLNEKIIYPTNGGWQELNSSVERRFNIPVFEVAKDDIIYVVVDCGAAGKEHYDLTYVSIIAHFAEDGSSWTNTYDSKAAFVDTDANYSAFSYWSYYYDASIGGDNKPDDSTTPGGSGNSSNTGDNNDPVISVGGGSACGGSMGATSMLAIAIMGIGAAAVKLNKKRS